ncbi:putative Leucine-rich repeat protein kinase family protein [Hibiscus syriacus]|uniref:Leucine-rich repeat protein kinase family protein n=1 Tax=Hibiscus syriacus TaxID=106335 RepID=A0A6A2YPC6_HIBSY|nr:putative Leucine-rich repeat protein kinase family protein [Hibiscus syriacus]
MRKALFSLALLIICRSFMATFSMKLNTILTDQSALLALKDHVVHDPENVFATNWVRARSHPSTSVGKSIIPFSSLPNKQCFSWQITGPIIQSASAATLKLRQQQLQWRNPIMAGIINRASNIVSIPQQLQGCYSVLFRTPPKLEILSLYENQISGSIPSSIFDMSSLQSINLRNNMLSGSIPSVPSDLLSLKSIDFTYNNLTGHVPKDMFDHLPKLEGLYLSANMLSGEIPTSLFKCKELRLLSLSYNQLEGSLPVEIGNLSMLQTFYIRENNFEGEIPEQIGNLTLLRDFDCSYNNFLGSIPPSIFNLSSLQKLNLGNNMLSGSIPSASRDLLSLEYINFSINNLTGHIPNDLFDHLPRLKQLFLGVNLLSGRIPASLFNCKELQNLSLAANQMEGSLPAEIGNLNMLQFIYLSRNHFIGEIPKQIVNLTLMKMFACPYNNFTGTIPHEIGNLKNLEFLDFGVNNIAGSVPPTIFNISTLSVISLYSNQLSGYLPSNVGLWLPNLKGLYLGGNQLVGPLPMSISNASQLTELDVSSNYFSGVELSLFFDKLYSLGVLGFQEKPFDQWRTSWFGRESLKLSSVVYASGCDIRGSIPSEIGNLSRLIIIELDGNKLTGSIPASIGGLEELQSLSLQHNMLEGSIPNELCNLNKLAFLFFTSNKLSGPIPACLGNLISLRNIFLGSNTFSSSIPSTLTGLNDLLILHLSSNSLSGALPIDIGKWKVLTSIDFSNNQFSGDIPTGVADLKDLTHFSLSNNRIAGSIPESFGDLLSLEFLDLSRNNLSGEIPKSLEKLSYLKYFNVSFNRLQGEIPEGGSFGNYSIESFKGNEALCGAPQLHLLSCKPVRNSKARTKLILYATLPIVSTILVMALIIIILRRRKRKDKLPTEEDLLPLGTWSRFSYQELHQATDGFSQRKLLGNGSYGSVYHGILSDGMEIAVKVFELELERGFKSFDVECEILRNYRHRNLIKVISSCSNNLDFRALVLEFMPNGSLDKWLYSDHHFLDILQRLNTMIDVASALEYLHHGLTTPVVHCDLKPSNVLLDEDMVAHLSDFGIAKLLCEEDSMIQTMTIATFGYMAPEYGDGGIVSTRGDVYTFANDCALSILQVGLECTAELPDERLNSKEIVPKLKKIRAKFLKDTERVRLTGLILVLLLNINRSSLSIESTDITTDRLALLELKANIEDPRNHLATNWSISASVCDWIGVTCGSKHPRVTSLVLSNMCLTGTIPPHLGNLSFLARLDIENNGFQGTLPMELANLHRLNISALVRTTSVGKSLHVVIPSSLCYLPKLEILDFHQNNLKGQIPEEIGNLPSLKALYLQNNQISGSIPSSIFNISSLQDVEFKSNYLISSIPSIPNNMSSLQIIDFGWNNLTGHLPWNMFDHLPLLQEIYLDRNQFSGEFPPGLFKHEQLQVLFLSHNQFGGTLPEGLGNLTTLTLLFVGWNNFRGEIPWQIGNLIGLESLSFIHGGLEGKIPIEISNLPNLNTLYLGNNLSGPIPLAIFNNGVFITSNKSPFRSSSSYSLASSTSMLLSFRKSTFWRNPTIPLQCLLSYKY